MYHVTVNRERPDYRVFIDLLFGKNRNVDTDGNSCPVNSRTWTYLYITDRDGEAPSVEIAELPHDPGIFSIVSDNERLAELATIYLFTYSGLSISTPTATLSTEDINVLNDKYSMELGNARSAVWHLSSDVCPYPNLK
ncbi:hypothetical protein ACO0K9_15560 [Undibacterium sp. Ji50W]